MSKRMAAVFLALIIAVSTCVFIFFSEQKEGYHCDEIYSCGLSNSDFHYRMYNEDGSIRINTPEDIDAYMTASDAHRFDYANVYKNQAEDVHPPLFYIFMHTFSSFTPGEHSIYHAIITNMLFAAGTALFLYLITLRISGKRSVALVAATVYALSANCINMVTYMRMYEMLAFFTTAAVYVHLRLLQNGCRMTKKLAVALGTVVFLGSYTQYYFFIFMAGLAIWTVAVMLKHKKKKELLVYLAVIAVTALIYMAVWPYVFRHLFASGRGEEAFSNMVQSSFFESFVFYLNVMRNGVGNLFSAFVIITAVVFLIKTKKEGNGIFRKLTAHKDVCMLMFIAFFYFLLILRVSPYQTDRYIAPIFPIISVFVALLLKFVYLLLRKVCKKRVLGVVFCVFAFLGIFTGIYDAMYGGWDINWDSNYLYDISEEHMKIFEEHSGKKCVMVRATEAYAMWNMPDYKHFEETVFVFPEEIEMLRDNDNLKNETELILYMSLPVDCEENVEKVKEIFGFDSHQYLIFAEHRNHSSIYLISKNETKEKSK